MCGWVGVKPKEATELALSPEMSWLLYSVNWITLVWLLWNFSLLCSWTSCYQPNTAVLASSGQTEIVSLWGNSVISHGGCSALELKAWARLTFFQQAELESSELPLGCTADSKCSCIHSQTEIFLGHWACFEAWWITGSNFEYHSCIEVVSGH